MTYASTTRCLCIFVVQFYYCIILYDLMLSWWAVSIVNINIWRCYIAKVALGLYILHNILLVTVGDYDYAYYNGL